MKFARLLAVGTVLAFMAGCGDDESSGSVTRPDVKAFSSVTDFESEYDEVANTLMDLRDSQIYRTVSIGDQIWMAENLNYAYIDVPYSYIAFTSDSTSWCFGNALDNCTKYGRLYTWAAAMDSVGRWSTNGKGCGYETTCSPTYPVRGICPAGWHLPTQPEWETLFAAVGGKSTAGEKLKSASGWSSSGNGTDDYSFAALPADSRNDGGSYLYKGYFAKFWSSSEVSGGTSYNISLSYSDVKACLDKDYKINGFSVRCVKD